MRCCCLNRFQEAFYLKTQLTHAPRLVPSLTVSLTLALKASIDRINSLNYQNVCIHTHARRASYTAFGSLHMRARLMLQEPYILSCQLNRHNYYYCSNNGECGAMVIDPAAFDGQHTHPFATLCDFYMLAKWLFRITSLCQLKRAQADKQKRGSCEIQA